MRPIRFLMPPRWSIAVLTVMVFAVWPSAASAAVFNVNTAADLPDAAQDGVCDSSATTAGEQCTLRAAAREANVGISLDRINVPAGTFALGSQVAFTSDVEIVGAGARSTAITGGSLSFAGSCTGVGGLCSAQLSDLAVRNGGGVTSRSHLSLARVTVRDNTKGPTTNLAPFGGGVFVGAVGGLVASNLTIADSTISGNKVVGFPSFLPNGMGGGVAVVSTGTVTITNSTIAGNNATGQDALGGGLGMQMANVTVRNSTVVGNSATATTDQATGGSLYRTISADAPQPGTLVVTDSIVSGGSVSGPGVNTGPNCSAGAVTGTSGRNIDSGSSCGFGSPSLSGTNPALGALGDNGGPTDTALPADSSPALDAALAACPSADQRGIGRPQGAACDIGAVERAVAGTPPDGGDPGGTPGGDPGGTPGGDPGSTPGGDPGSTPGGDPTGTPGGDPTGTPGGDPTGDPGGDPSGDLGGDPAGGGDTGTAGPGTSDESGCIRPVSGTARANMLKGSPFGDLMVGGRGNDRMAGGRGDDCLSGQGGSDRLSGGAGNDVLSGGRGNDRLVGGPGVDVLNGGPGSDLLDARRGGRDIVACGSGRDLVKADRTDRVKRGCERIALR